MGVIVNVAEVPEGIRTVPDGLMDPPVPADAVIV
jgi:hypothetical protein